MNKKIMFTLLLSISFQTQAVDFDSNILDVSKWFSTEEEFSVNKAERLFALMNALHLDKNGILQSKYHNYDFDMLYQGKNVFVRPFDGHIYNLYVHESYARSWHDFIGKYDPLGDSVQLLLTHYEDIAKRLTKAYENKQTLSDKYKRYYGNDDYLVEIDEDIQRLSELGWELTAITQRFHDTIRPVLVNREMSEERVKARQDIVGGNVTSFSSNYSEREIYRVLKIAIDNVNYSIAQLERSKLLLGNP